MHHISQVLLLAVAIFLFGCNSKNTAIDYDYPQSADHNKWRDVGKMGVQDIYLYKGTSS